MNSEYHLPVLQQEVINELNIKPNGKYIDCTLGDGGHTIDILKKSGIVLGIDVSKISLDRAHKRIKELNLDKNFIPVHGNFKDLGKICNENKYYGVSGILYDLGYSSYQLDDSELGLSFLHDKPLDMRLDTTLGVTAADLVNALSEKQLSDIIFNYSDEKFAKKFAKAIVNYRSLKKIETTKQLADLLASQSSLRYENGRIHPATRTFQALRIAVNNELENIQLSLPQASQVLLPAGKIVVISFHSLEDKAVKDFAKNAGPKINMLTKKPIVPTNKEIASNSRSRSAKMRILTKLDSISND